MEQDIREKIALKRYQIISPVLAEPARAQNEYFRTQAHREHTFPRYGVKKLSVSTMKTWLRKYRSHGFEALKPAGRKDRGRPRRLDEQTLKSIEVKCTAYPLFSIRRLYEELRDQGLLGEPPVHYNTLVRVIKEQGWLHGKARTDVRKAYEVADINELWVADFMHGPKVRVAKGSAKAILCAILDDHSRMVAGHAFSASETISALTVVLKEAFLGYGIPKRLYVDNGPSFSSELLARSCALAGISLIHSKPYDSPGAKSRDSFVPSGIVSSPAYRRGSASRSSTRPSGYGSRTTTTISSTPVSMSGPSTATRPLLREWRPGGSPRQSWMRSSSSATSGWSTTTPPSASRAFSTRCPPPISGNV